jgi:coenzyme F420 hydrogenase subunit delta
MADYLEKEILVLGCGNILFGDDGFGSAVITRINELKAEEGTDPVLKSEKVGFIDAGTAASHFVISLIDDKTPVRKVIIADIIDYGLSPGTLKKLSVDDLPDIPKYHVDAHDMPLAGMLRDVHDKYNVEIVVIGCQFKVMSAPDVCFELSDEAAAAVDPAIGMIIEELKKSL